VVPGGHGELLEVCEAVITCIAMQPSLWICIARLDSFTIITFRGSTGPAGQGQLEVQRR